MSTNGPTRTFSEAEIQKFKPVFMQLIKKDITWKQAGATIGRDDFEKFKSYYKISAALLKAKQAHKKIEKNEARKEILHQQNLDLERQIEASRSAAAQKTSGKLDTVTVKNNL